MSEAVEIGPFSMVLAHASKRTAKVAKSLVVNYVCWSCLFEDYQLFGATRVA